MQTEKNFLHTNFQENPFSEPTTRHPVLILTGDTRELIKTIPDNTFQCAVTSPPYWGVRDYGVENQIGAEPDIEDYISDLVSIFQNLEEPSSQMALFG